MKSPNAHACHPAPKGGALKQAKAIQATENKGVTRNLGSTTPCGNRTLAMLQPCQGRNDLGEILPSVRNL